MSEMAQLLEICRAVRLWGVPFAGLGGPRDGIVSTVTIAGFPQQGQIFGSKGRVLRISMVCILEKSCIFAVANYYNICDK